MFYQMPGECCFEQNLGEKIFHNITHYTKIATRDPLGATNMFATNFTKTFNPVNRASFAFLTNEQTLKIILNFLLNGFFLLQVKLS